MKYRIEVHMEGINVVESGKVAVVKTENALTAQRWKETSGKAH